jgi:hypothetical protein
MEMFLAGICTSFGVRPCIHDKFTDTDVVLYCTAFVDALFCTVVEYNC